ncbi:hypothetical protein M569_12328, partial [Genlisea aurea]
EVHVSLSGDDDFRISWIAATDSAPPVVYYGASPHANSFSAAGTTASYTYGSYTSGNIHNAVIGPLEPGTQYFYRFDNGTTASPVFNFTTPPPSFPIKFAIVGDLGQTGWTQSTLDHVARSNYDVFLLPGDLSYADEDEPLWDTYGNLVQALAASRPWMTTEGNHEIESGVGPETFTAYNARWSMPHLESSSKSNLYYSFEVAGVHVMMLGSYTDFDSDSDQYAWLVNDLKGVDRSKTPWVLALMHAPWYSSNKAHYGEPESVNMKADMETLLYDARVDAVFAGHVHAYERFDRVYKNRSDACGPVYVTVGDGGNREGLATKWYSQPSISMFRESSFGHGELLIVNETHAHWTWHRNQDDESVVSDEIWLHGLADQSTC